MILHELFDFHGSLEPGSAVGKMTKKKSSSKANWGGEWAAPPFPLPSPQLNLLCLLLLFSVQVNPRNPVKFTKTCKIQRNSIEILSNTCLYSIFETYLNYWGYLIAVNLQSFLETLSLKHANNVPKLPGVDYVVKNWALAMMFKALLLVRSFLEPTVVERANFDLC